MEGRIWNEHGTYHLHCFISKRKSLKLASIHSTSFRRLRSGGGAITCTLPPSHSYLPSTWTLPSSITTSLPLSHPPPSLHHSDGSEDSLKVLVHARQQSRGAQMDNFFDSLQQKYAKKQKSSSKAGGRITRHQAAREQGRGKRRSA